jgi:RimJ/RimL family protein N-acetyltransferase
MFTTERLILRPYQESDLEHLLRMHNNLRVQRTVTIDYIVPRGPKFQEKILELIYKPLLFVIVMLKETGMFIGLSSVNVGPGKNRDGTFGIVLHPDYWNKGYGTEVTKFIMDYSFRCLAMNRMSLAVLESNRAAIAIYEKV